ncbi:hypothetical protein M406DRAFT_67771 [Cryphonectria parasitica EP155]|uniref:Ketoreductase domain-containing protein n=1 Tax=Cryphonectria parasitica (strain ATCC 38755 / EP155) TaxID=660469 RepID=A0A9P4Y373_CRYP1|nr:uncharacterized protein M406DRAFT_67771 [Cryphonectria parasitica EP155]KAF3765315.1 hypothetical protein M406DRAFT_67771 [Cryphonectria parasitica EP155]
MSDATYVEQRVGGNTLTPAPDHLKMKVPSICFTLDWDVDVDLLEPEEFDEVFPDSACKANTSTPIEKLEEVSFYYVEAALAELTEDNVAAMDPLHKLFLAWMQQQVDRAHAGTLRYCKPSWLSATPEQKDAAIAFCKDSGTDGQILCHMGANLTRVMRKEVDPLDLLSQDGLQLSLSYDLISDYVHKLSHKHPDLEILEINSGTGGVSRSVLKKLGGHHGVTPRFAHYTRTDVSSRLLEKAQETLEDYGSLISFKKLDLGQDAATQGFETGSYDLVVVTIRACEDIDTTLRHIRKLLKRDGKLAVVDITNNLMRPTIIFGTLPSWWLGTSGHRSQDEWDELLKETGFSGIQTCRSNYANVEDRSCTIIISAAVEVNKTSHTNAAILPTLLVVPKENSTTANLILQKITENTKGPVQSVGLGSIPDTTGKVCVFLTEIERPMMDTVDEEEFQAVKQAIIKSNGVLWIGRGGAIESPIPESNLITGLGRTIRRENAGIKFVTLNLDLNSPPEKAADIAQRLFSRTMTHIEETRSQDFEYASRNGQVLIPRIMEDTQTNSFIAKDSVVDSLMELNKDASYLLVGGLGGLGRSLGAWMASHGARHLIFLSRSGAERPDAQEAVNALNAMGVHVAVYKCDVSNQASLEKTIQQCRDEMPPIKGVIHGGMVLRNSTFHKMGYSNWEQTLQPKVSGTNNLCRAFSGHETTTLDFFIILSSSVGVIGNYGQGNYAASSTFQDAIAHHYASSPNGLPIVTIDLGMILGAGYVAENSNAAAILKKLGIMGISQAQFLSIIKATIMEPRRARPRCQIMTGLGTKAMVSEDGSWDDGEEYKVPFYFQDTKFSHLLQVDRRMTTIIRHINST